LIQVPDRTVSDYRQYAVADAERINFIVGNRALGFHLDEIRSLLRLASEEALSCAARSSAVEWQGYVRRHSIAT
jgi:MerR family mercuric resistance operon transcriptional regulator